MIPDRDRYGGSAIAYLIDRWDGSLTFKRLHDYGTGFYLIANSLPIFVKHSKARRGPWSFNFQPPHLRSLREVAGQFGECAAVFVCGTDGIAAVRFKQFETLTNPSSDAQEVVTVRRKLREMYALNGSIGVLDGKVGSDSLLELLQQHVSRS